MQAGLSNRNSLPLQPCPTFRQALLYTRGKLGAVVDGDKISVLCHADRTLKGACSRRVALIVIRKEYLFMQRDQYLDCTH